MAPVHATEMPTEYREAAATRFSFRRKTCVSSNVLYDIGDTVASARAQMDAAGKVAGRAMAAAAYTTSPGTTRVAIICVIAVICSCGHVV